MTARPRGPLPAPQGSSESSTTDLVDWMVEHQMLTEAEAVQVRAAHAARQGDVSRPAPAALDAVKMFVDTCCSTPGHAALTELYDAFCERTELDPDKFVLADFASTLGALGWPACHGPDGTPPCMHATRAGPVPPCGRVPTAADGGITTRHGFRQFGCRNGLGLVSRPAPAR